ESEAIATSQKQNPAALTRSPGLLSLRFLDRLILVPGADLHRLTGVADHAAIRVVDRLRGPVAPRVSHRLAVAFVNHIAPWPRREDRAGDDRAADDARGHAGAPAPAATTPLRIGVGCRNRQRTGEGGGRDQCSHSPFHEDLLRAVGL